MAFPSFGGFFDSVKQGALGGAVRAVLGTPSGQAAVKDEVGRQALQFGRWLPWVLAGGAVVFALAIAFWPRRTR